MLRFLFRVGMLVALIGAGTYYWAYEGIDLDAKQALKGIESAGRERLRDAGDGIAQVAAAGATHATTLLSDVQLTAKITSKMALDDTIAARRLDVDTRGAIVTVSGTVETEAQRRRALDLARETDGVTSVVDRIEVRPPDS